LSLVPIILAFFFREKSRFKAQPKHVPAGLRVEPHEHEAEGLLGAVGVQIQDRFGVVDPAELLAQRFDLLAVAQSPHAHATAVLSDDRAHEVQDLAGDDPGDPEMAPASRERNQPTPLVPALPLRQNIAPISQVIKAPRRPVAASPFVSCILQ
jgi:hypothetical protein